MSVVGFVCIYLPTMMRYLAMVPMTGGGLMINIKKDRHGGVFFNGYRTNTDGSKGAAEQRQVFRAKYDLIVKVDNTETRNMTLKAVAKLLKRRTPDNIKRIWLTTFIVLDEMEMCAFLYQKGIKTAGGLLEANPTLLAEQLAAEKEMAQDVALDYICACRLKVRSTLLVKLFSRNS